MNLINYLILFLTTFSTFNFVKSFEVGNGLVLFKSVIGLLAEAIELYDEFSNDPLSLSRKEKKLYETLGNITKIIENVEDNVSQVTIAKIKQLERDFANIIHFEIKLEDLVKQINEIESKYDSFLDLRDEIKMKIDNSSSSKDIAVRHTLTDFADSVVSYKSGSIRNYLDGINDLIDIRESTSIYLKNDIFSLILDNFSSKTASRCIIDKSPQQLIFDTYTSLRLVQIKGLMLFEFSYIILHLYTNGDYKAQVDKIYQKELARFEKQMEIANKVINSADNSFWRCDPKKHVRDVTYTELTHLVQGYVHNEIELNHKRNCFEGCNYYQYVNNAHCNDDKLCKQQPTCKGRVFDCKFVDEDMKICFSNTSTSRRYDWIHYYNGQVFGKKDKFCPYSESPVEGYRKFLFWRCLYCFCYCDEETKLSDRYFSLEPAVSNISDNKIVIGIRFVKQNRVIHLQVQEGKLLPGGVIDNQTLAWVSLPSITVGNWLDVPKYHKLSYESRAIDLDDIVAPAKYLVTGVRLRTIGAHLNLEVQLTGFNFLTGELYSNLTFWKGNDNTDVSEYSRRNEYKLYNKNLPIEFSEDYNIPDSSSDSFLEFQPSDEITDAAQSTVPFIDIQAVAPQPPIPLTGVGIIHKGSYSSAGFIELKVFTYNLAEAIAKNDIK
ncbi:hypothetical protein PGB90_009070 [Kerria lacca]